MIGRGSKRESPTEQPKGFDSFELKLGDIMRGERATLGKSLLDVQRELKIKAAYIAAIENSDPSAFDTPGFIAGYVRSYARYLGMDPDEAFATFCTESGFATAHGMSKEASVVSRSREERLSRPAGGDIFNAPATPFIPEREAVLSGIEPRAVGSVFVLVALIGGLGYGGWTVLQEVQRVQFAPVEQTPDVLSELQVDPLAGGGLSAPRSEAGGEAVAAISVEALDRLYRPQVLEAPVMVPRDGPIATLDPRSVGALAPYLEPDPVQLAVAARDAPEPVVAIPPSAVQVTEALPPQVELVAVRPAWVRVRSADGSVIYEATMAGGETWTVPLTENPPTLRVGESGAVYFNVNGTHYGPVGEPGQVTSNLALSIDNLTDSFAVADLSQDSDLAELVRVAEVQAGQ